MGLGPFPAMMLSMVDDALFYGSRHESGCYEYKPGPWEDLPERPAAPSFAWGPLLWEAALIL